MSSEGSFRFSWSPISQMFRFLNQFIHRNKFNFYVISLLFLFPSIFPLFPTFCYRFFLSLFSTYLRYFVVKRIPLNLGAVVFVVVSKFIHKFMSPCSALALLEQFSKCFALRSLQEQIEIVARRWFVALSKGFLIFFLANWKI